MYICLVCIPLLAPLLSYVDEELFLLCITFIAIFDLRL